MMIRIFDIVFSIVGLIVLLPVLLFLLLLGWLDTGSPLFRQQRVGQYKKVFVLFKFRTMQRDTAAVSSHLVDASAVTPCGRFLRKTKLDELPQLWNVLKGDMSLVGPRPCLMDQELIAEREKRGVYSARPGITGLAQVNKIDMSMPKLLAKMDQKMLSTLNIVNYFKYIFLTILGKGSGDRIKDT